MVVREEKFAAKMRALFDGAMDMKAIKRVQQEALQYYSDAFTRELQGFPIGELVFVIAAIEIHLSGLKRNIPGIEEAIEGMKAGIHADVVSITVPTGRG